ncbi:MAG TPA: molybdopterin-dependent oxidoreductase, partial [Candidatus Dormibacteraeota bacterium]|nr:molybdopterin-dependent oxidoreductase [Candidatus Dormibacteraeota bacterium]
METVSRPAGTLIESPDVTPEELQLAVRNHSMPLEALRYDITPLGLHYLLIHFDIPAVDPAAYELTIGGVMVRPLRLKLSDIRSRPRKTLAVTLECAGNGRARLSPRPMSQPWLSEAVGTAEWTGTPLGPILEEAVVEGEEVVFTGMDRGIQGGVVQYYERSLSFADAIHPDVLLAYEMNGRPLLPQHGFPVRLIVPGWYGMAHVKWLRSITVLLNREFAGYQQARAYHYRVTDGDPGEPVTRILPRALMVPPGVPDFMSRTRFVEPGTHLIQGRAWSGRAKLVEVEFSADGGSTWAKARLEDSASPYAWAQWTHDWDVTRLGEYEL